MCATWGINYLPVIGEWGRGALLLFFFAIVMITLWLGLSPGVLSLILSLIGINLFILVPIWRLAPYDALFLNIGFCFLSSIIIILIQYYLRQNLVLLESQQDLSLAQEVAQVGSWRFKVKGDELYWTDEKYRIFEIPVGAKVTIDTFFSAIHPDDREYVDRMWQASLRGEPYDIEHRIIVAGDKVKWIREKAILEFAKNGMLLGGFGTTQDITERKLAEQELSDREQKLQLTMDLSPNLVAYLSTDFRYLRINKTYETWWNKKPEQILGHEVREIVGDQAWLYINPYLQQALSGASVSFDYHGASGRWVHINYVPDVASTGEVKGIVVNVANITEQKLSEQRLIDQEKQLCLIMNLVPALISYLDTDLKYLRANKTYEDWYGLSVSDLIGQNVQDIIHEQTWALAKPCLDLTLNGEYSSFEGVGLINGVERWLKASYVPDLNENGKVKGIVVHVADITHQKNHELALIEKENALKLIINAMPALVAYVDTNFRYVRVNMTYEKWLGIPVEKIVGSEIKDIVGDPGWQKIKPYIERAMLGEEIHFDFLMPYKTGKARWIHANYVPDFDTTGQVKGLVALVVDISEITEAQQEIGLLNETLQNRVDEMEAIFDTAPIGLSIADNPDGKHIRGNKMLEQMVGLPPNSELSLANKDFALYKVYQDGREFALEELPMQRAIQGETVRNFIIDIQRHDGQRVSVLSNAAPIFNKLGIPRGAVGAFLDITSLKNAEAALFASEERLRLAQNAGALGIYDHNLVTGEVQWDKRILEIWGLTPLQQVNLPTFLSTVHPDDYSQVKAGVRQSFDPKGSGEYHAEYRVIRPIDKRVVWVSAYGVASFKDNKAVRLVGFVQDITERKLSELRLLETEAQLAIALKELNAAYWDWNLESNETFFSPEFKMQLGYSDNEMPNRYEEWETSLHPEDKEGTLASIDRFLSGETSNYDLEFRLRHKDGTYRYIHSRAALTQLPYKRLVGINLDITAFKNEIELSQQRNKMEEAFQLNIASQTVAAIAHELNQPLTAISYFADVAVDMLQTGNKKPEKLVDILENCSLQAQRAGHVIRQLMSVLQKGDIQIEPIDINKMVTYAYEYIKGNNELHSFCFEMNLSKGLPQVRANTLQIQKILINIIQNSLEAMLEIGKRNGTVTIATRFYPDDPSMIEVTISDNGIGVSDTAILSKMFQPFYTTKSNGLGMGLAISRTLIEAHGGKMWAEQNADIGISVHFTLSLAT